MSLIDGDEIEDQLIAMGADEMEPDKVWSLSYN